MIDDEETVIMVVGLSHGTFSWDYLLTHLHMYLFQIEINC